MSSQLIRRSSMLKQEATAQKFRTVHEERNRQVRGMSGKIIEITSLN